MMAMTPIAKKQLDDIENAFLEAVESHTPKPSMPAMKKQAVHQRRGWFSGLKERLVMKFVCCAPPQSLLDDDEIQEILMQIEAPSKPKPAASRRDTLQRRSSAMVMPVTRADEPQNLSDITHVLEAPSNPCPLPLPAIDLPIESEDHPLKPQDPTRPHLKLSTVQLAVVCLCSLQKSAETRSSERVARFIQNRWRIRKPTAPTTEPVSSPPPSPVTEPDIEPATKSPPATSPSRPRRRLPRVHAAKKTKSAVAEEVHEAVECLTQLAQTRKRLRSVHLELALPCVDVERDVHVLFGEEEIDEDLHSAPTSPCISPFAVSRCASVPPPPTAFRPIPVKTQALKYTQAARVLQRAWRAFRLRQTFAVRRSLTLYETQTQSVMPTIRSKMAELRKRLHDIQERNSLTPTPSPIAAISDEDYDWL